MVSFKNSLSLILATLIISVPSLSLAKKFHLSGIEMEEVIQIANAINVVNPHLEEGKYLEYAMGIHRAALKYSVEPTVLIAIAQQETGFREALPEGAAGEIGIIQIRKMWLKNKKFVAEFKNQSINDLKKASKSFMFAAWILKGLRGQIQQGGTLPYWSYYNSVRFENRFKYFLAVNRNIATLRQFDASAWDSQMVATAEKDRAPAQAPMKVAQLSRPVPVAAPVVVKDPQGDRPVGDRWIPDAIRRIQGNRSNPSLVRTAQELDLASMFTPSLQD